MAAKSTDKPKKPSEYKTPEDFLRANGIELGKIMQVWSTGDSDLGGETYIVLDAWNHPKTVVVYEGEVICRDGWDWFNVVYA